VVERILAEDFVGVDPDGRFLRQSKNGQGHWRPREIFFVNHLNEVKVRFYGDAAVAQGTESWVRRSGPRRMEVADRLPRKI